MTWTLSKLLVRETSWTGTTTDYAVEVGSDGLSNPYRGDTSTDECLPIVCVKKTGETVPSWFEPIHNPHRTRGGALRGSWVGGDIGFTKPILGRSLNSLAEANKICEDSFGSGFRMGSHHDGSCPPDSGCGGAFTGKLVLLEGQDEIQIRKKDRFWIYIRDQRANPWS